MTGGSVDTATQRALRPTAAPVAISGERTLRAAAVLWFAVTVVGQWVFLYYVAAFYGPSTLSGDFEAWNRNPMLRGGYVEGDLLGNLAFAVHSLLAAVIAFGGPLQLVPQIRARAIAVHRWNGRLFMLVSVAAAVTGLYMVAFRDATGGLLGSISISLNAALILTFTGLAWRAVRRHDIASHRRWALRTFMVVNGVFFLRLGFMAWMVISQGQSSDAVFHVLEFASYLLPLVMLQLYLHATENGGSRTQYATAGALLACTAYMSLGMFAFYMGVVQRVLA